MQTVGKYCPQEKFLYVDDCILIDRKSIKNYATHIMTLKFTAIIPW